MRGACAGVAERCLGDRASQTLRYCAVVLPQSGLVSDGFGVA